MVAVLEELKKKQIQVMVLSRQLINSSLYVIT